MIKMRFRTGDRFSELSAAAKKEAQKRLIAMGESIATDARTSMVLGHGKPSRPGTPPHIQTGELKNSIGVRKEDGVVYVATKRPEGWSGFWYPPVHEFGLGKFPRRPFLRPAFNRALARLADSFKDLLKSVSQKPTTRFRNEKTGRWVSAGTPGAKKEFGIIEKEIR